MTQERTNHPVPDVSDPLPGSPESMSMPMQKIEMDLASEPVKLSVLLAEAGITATQIPAAELLDQEVRITSLKPFRSSFQEEAHCYYAHITVLSSGEKLATVLGGGAVVDILDAVMAAGIRKPIDVTLRFVKGGAFKGYYTLE